MEKLTVTFTYLDNGNVKATFYEDTNKYITTTISTDVAGCLTLFANRLSSFEMYVGESLSRRAL